MFWLIPVSSSPSFKMKEPDGKFELSFRNSHPFLDETQRKRVVGNVRAAYRKQVAELCGTSKPVFPDGLLDAVHGAAHYTAIECFKNLVPFDDRPGFQDEVEEAINVGFSFYRKHSIYFTG